MISNQEFANRRKKLLDQLGKGNAAILFSSNEQLRNGDVHYPFRQNSEFYYFTGFNESDAVAVFLPGRKEGEYILFNLARNPEMERWLGPRAGQEGASQYYGANQSFNIDQLDEKMMEFLAGVQTIYYELGKNKGWDQKITDWTSKLHVANRKELPSPRQLADLTPISYEMRLIKSDAEKDCLRKASKISANAHTKLMEICRPGMYEYELEARFDYEIKINNCRFSAYPAIVGGGGNACVLHYVDNKDQLKDGELVLVDAGAEFENYAADITRTFPVNGKFTKDQALIYEIVLRAQLAVIEAIRPGLRWNRLQEIAVQELCKGLIELGILSGKVQEIVEKKAYLPYYMHNIGHWLGMDVHDVGAYKVEGEWRPLEEGMLLTVEPGLYLSPCKDLAKRWWNIGIRIEDDVLVTAHGAEVLTAEVPKTIKEIEAIMRHT